MIVIFTVANKDEKGLLLAGHTPATAVKMIIYFFFIDPKDKW